MLTNTLLHDLGPKSDPIRALLRALSTCGLGDAAGLPRTA